MTVHNISRAMNEFVKKILYTYLTIFTIQKFKYSEIKNAYVKVCLFIIDNQSSR